VQCSSNCCELGVAEAQKNVMVGLNYIYVGNILVRFSFCLLRQFVKDLGWLHQCVCPQWDSRI